MLERRTTRILLRTALAIALLSGFAPRAHAEEMCDPSFEDCRSRLITLIRNETVGIDVAFWFMEDQRYMTEIIKRWQAGVPVRLLVDPRATDAGYPANGPILDGFRNAGMPMRKRTASGILHWKMMLFAGQGIVEFSGANYSPDAWLPVTPYSNYVDESIYFSDDPSIVQSFMTKYDELWLNTTKYADYANITSPPARVYPVFTKNPELNFPETEDYANRATGRYSRETKKIDIIMYRVTDERHTNAMIAAQARGVAVRLISDTFEYRKVSRLWHSYNLDRLWAAGIPVRVRAHDGLNHQKSILLYGQTMVIFGSSNWTTPSANQQQEHNLFTTKPQLFQWFVSQFERKWNNSNPVAAVETADFIPLPPDKPANRSIANLAVGVATTGQKLKWYGGPWAHLYDVYFGLDPNPSLFAAAVHLGPSETTTQTQSFTLPALQPGTTYYWRIVARTMADKTANGPTWSFTTAGVPPAPPPPPPGAATINIWASDVTTNGLVGLWSYVDDPTAAGGQALLNPDKGKSTVSPPLAAPSNFFETSFTAVAGVPYHLWIRLRAYNNSLSNNAVSVQFNDSVDAFGSATYRIGTGSGAEITLQDGASGAQSGWGWADNGYGTFGPDIYFASTGTHTIRVQQRRDGAVVDQVVLSPDTYVRTPPGVAVNDETILPSTISGATPVSMPPPSPQRGAQVGTVGINGTVRYDGATGVYRLISGGGDIWGTADGMYFVHQPLTGDGSIVARVTGVQNTNVWARAGVMVRESLVPNAANAYVYLSGGKTLAFQRRLAAGGSTIGSTAAANATLPSWVRLDRAGNSFTGYVSRDGVSWTFAGSDTVPMGETVLVGLAGTSLSAAATSLATLDSVTITSGTPTAPVPPPDGSLLPSGWSHRDVGAFGFTGDAAYDATAGVWTIKGAGADIWDVADGYHFAYQTLSGDGTIVARVKSQQNTNNAAKAGVMIRDGLSAGAANVMIGVTPAKGNILQQRVVAGGTTTSVAGAAVKAPFWVRLDRAGSTFTAYESADGATWTPVGTSSVSMGATVYVGLAVTSHSQMVTSAAAFDAVAVSGFSGATDPPPPPPPATGTLPAGWNRTDVGAVGTPGDATYDSAAGVFSVTGAGADVWGTADAFHYAYRALMGDGTVVARVANVQGTAAWVKAGVMIRESTAASSAHGFMLVSYSKGLAYQRRPVTGGASVSTAGPAASAPYWVKIERLGSTINAYASPDGVSWAAVGWESVPMSTTVYVGLAVSSHTTSGTATVTFDNVTVTP